MKAQILKKENCNLCAMLAPKIKKILERNKIPYEVITVDDLPDAVYKTIGYPAIKISTAKEIFHGPKMLRELKNFLKTVDNQE